MCQAMEKNGQNPDKLDEPASGYDKMNEMEQNDSCLKNWRAEVL